jgi:hypothetical protein
MKDISNKALAELVLLAVVVSLAGTTITLSKLSASTGGVVGQAKVNVTAVVAISLPVNTVDFGAVFQGSGDNTTDGSPAPLQIQNDGGVFVNVSASGTVLFSGTGGGDNTATFQWKARENGAEPNAFNLTNSVTSFRNVTVSTVGNFVSRLNFSDTADTALVDVLIAVPFDESIGQKTSNLTFTAIQS